MSRIVALRDAEGSFASHREAFGLDDDDPWRLVFYVYVVELGTRTVVVDAGVGPPGGDDPFLPERQGMLPAELERNGVLPADVDLVVLTHLHPDHVGWTMNAGEPFFANARYVVHRDDYEWVTGTRPERPYVREKVVALAQTGRLELVEGIAEPLPGVRLLRTGGHTPGHCIVELEDATLVADIAVHEAQLARPELAYVAEEDPVTAAEVRQRLLSGLATSGRLVGFGHLGLGRVERAGDGFVFEPRD